MYLISRNGGNIQDKYNYVRVPFFHSFLHLISTHWLKLLAVMFASAILPHSRVSNSNLFFFHLFNNVNIYSNIVCLFVDIQIKT
ncbi:MAG: hypothetical protein EXX96DRAFT_547456 [Benjaminiella poitrasii]|nr:MAG: hypothetical protein EXX96DRAFT_547456 [Benjaminiella poitrasii]